MATPWLQVRDALHPKPVPIRSSVFTVGRDATNDLSLPSLEVSRKHVVIENDGEHVVLEDRGSRYGTLVNGARVLTRRELRPGDLIHLGASHGADLVFLGLEAEEATMPEIRTTTTGEVHVVRALLDGLRALGTSHLLDDVLRLVIDAALDLSGAERGFIMLANPSGHLEVRLGRGAGHVTLSQDVLTSRKVPTRVFETGEKHFEIDLADPEARLLHQETSRHGIRSVLCLPLNVRRYVEPAGGSETQDRIGVLYLDARERGALVTDATQGALQALSNEAAIAIDNARLYREHCERERLQQEIEIAAEIQRALLPDAALAMPTVALAATTLPCRSIGGDFYDHETLPDGRLAFWLGDVAGKGPPAALLSARIQGIFAALEPDQGVAAKMAQVNAALMRRAVHARFVTVFYAVIDPRGALVCCTAGHNPPLLVGRQGVRRLTVGGSALGLFGGLSYSEHVDVLEPGDWVVAFSDGVCDALNPEGVEFGEDRLLETVVALAEASPELLVQGVLDRLRAHTRGAPPYDDVTLLAVRFLGDPGIRRG